MVDITQLLIKMNQILKWIKNEWSFIFWMTAFNFTYIENFRIDNHGSHQIAEFISLGISNVFLPVILLDILILLLFGHWERICRAVKIFFLAVNVCLFTIDIFTIFYYGIPMDRAMFEVALATNFREGSEFLEMYIFNINLWGILFIIAFSLSLLRYFIGLLSKNKSGFLILSFSIAIFLAYSIYNTSFYHYDPQKAIAVFRLSSMLKGVYYDKIALKEMEDGNQAEIILTKNESRIPYVVFILGESTTRNRMSLYGYSLPTNPLLSERRRNEEIYVFNDVISPHSHTMLVMEKLFTFYRSGDKGSWFNYKNLFSIIQAAGYHTVWLSNQESAILGVIGKFFAEKCDINRFTLLRDRWDEGISYDEKILPLLDEILSLSSSFDKNFYVLHLMGTHMSYHYRYPSDFSKFSFSDEDGFDGITDAQKKIRAEYDNAILYNDFIVNEIIKRFENKNAIVIYISDHGEEVYEEKNFFGHEESIGSRYMIEIPMLIWVSKEFQDAFPDLEKRIAQSTEKPFMTDDMLHVILDIMDIESEEYRSELSIINQSFNEERIRIYSGMEYHKNTGLLKHRLH